MRVFGLVHFQHFHFQFEVGLKLQVPPEDLLESWVNEASRMWS